MDLYSTKVIPSTQDALWDPPLGLPDFKGSRLLVLSTPFEQGGPESQTLSKMTAACKLSPSEYTVIQLPAEQILAWRQLAAAGAPARILMLGVAPAQLAIDAMFRLNHCNDFLGATFIPGYTLAQMEQNPGAKRELWEYGLKPCFVH